jgi:hypothetical protein
MGFIWHHYSRSPKNNPKIEERVPSLSRGGATAPHVSKNSQCLITNERGSRFRNTYKTYYREARDGKLSPPISNVNVVSCRSMVARKWTQRDNSWVLPVEPYSLPNNKLHIKESSAEESKDIRSRIRSCIRRAVAWIGAAAPPLLLSSIIFSILVLLIVHDDVRLRSKLLWRGSKANLWNRIKRFFVEACAAGATFDVIRLHAVVPLSQMLCVGRGDPAKRTFDKARWL